MDISIDESSGEDTAVEVEYEYKGGSYRLISCRIVESEELKCQVNIKDL